MAIDIENPGADEAALRAALQALVLPAPFQGALVKKSLNQTGANYTTAAAIAWDAEVYDTDAIHSNVTENTKLFVPSGWTRVRLTGSARIASLTTDLWAQIILWKNGSDSFDGAVQSVCEIGGTTRGMSIVSPVLEVTGGTDYFELALQVATDTSIDVIAARSSFAMERVS